MEKRGRSYGDTASPTACRRENIKYSLIIRDRGEIHNNVRIKWRLAYQKPKVVSIKIVINDESNFY